MHNVCRLCLRKKAKQNIFDENSSVLDKLLSYCKLNIIKNDGLPDQICNSCVKKLEYVVEFIDKCEESDRLLRDNPGVLEKLQDIDIKEEPDIENDEKILNLENSCDKNNVENVVIDVDDKILNVFIKEEDLKENVDSRNDHLLPIIDDEIIPLGKLLKKHKHSIKKNKVKKTKTECQPEVIDSTELVDVKSEKIDFDDLPDQYLDDSCSENEASLDKTNLLKSASKKNRNSKFGDESQLCFTCGKCFPRASYLRQHILKHLGEVHKCGQCPKSFATRELMKVHERRHIQEKNFPCQVCGHTFTSGYLAKKHYKMVHERNYAVSCNLCNKVLSNRRSLMEHMKIHTGEKNFECKICNKKFAHKLSLVCHTRVHTGEQPYACRYCEKRFTILKSLKEHERLHTGEKPYGCPLCPKRFEQLGNMKSHFRYNHKGLDLKAVQEAKAKAETLATA